MSKFIVGVDGSDGSRDAIALASMLAGFTGSTLVLANAFPYDETVIRAANRQFEEYLRSDADALLERQRTSIEGDLTVETRAIPNSSPAHGLREAACPVIVFQRGAAHTEEDSVFAKVASLSV